MIKVLVVDDSTFMRNSLTRMLTSDPEIEVVGQAGDGIEALEKIKELNPDLISLDLEMPRMGGLEMLEKMMRDTPKPVLVISSLTYEGAEATLKALELGALDYMPKYVEGTTVFAIAQKELTEKVKALVKSPSTRLFLAKLRMKAVKSSVVAVRTPSAASAETAAASSVGSAAAQANAANAKLSSLSIKAVPGQGQATYVRPNEPLPTGRPNRDIVAISVSTGGPPAVQKVLTALPENFPACILIAQHMPAAFTGAFAKRLDSLCKITVKEAKNGDPIIPGIAYVCPGAQHISITIKGALPQIKVSPEPTTEIYKPCANILNQSVSIMGNKVVGLTMTGMGSDGCEGSKALKAKGGYLIAQSEDTCVVYGMPRAVVEAKIFNDIVDLDDISDALIRALYK